MEKSPENDRKKGCRYIRFVILAVAVIFLAFVQASVMAFNTAFVVLSDPVTSPLYPQYQALVNQSAAGSVAPQQAITEPKIPFDFAPSYLPLGLQRYPFTSIQRSFTFAASFAGGLLGTFPMLFVLRRVGAHMTMFMVGAMSALLCALTPQSISISVELFIALRFLSGFITAPVFPCIGTIIEEWGTMEEKGLFVSILTAHMEIAPLFALQVGSLIAENVSWTAVFYIHGLICALFTLAWLLIYRNDPATHPMIATEEVERIKLGKSHGITIGASPPYRSIFTSTSVWGVFAGAIGMIFVGQFMGIFSPQYFTSVLGYSPSLTGTLTIIPIVLSLPLKALTGVASDKITRLSEVCKLRLFNSLACFLGASFFLLVILIPPSVNVVAATALIMIPFVLLAFTTGGFSKAAVLISRQHSSFIFSIIHILAMLGLITGTFIIPLITPDNTFGQWKIVFIIFMAVLIITNSIFVIFVRAEPEEWADAKMEFVQLSEEPRTIQRRQTFI